MTLPDSQQSLVDDLEAADAPDWVVNKAESLHYHDYESPLPFPKVALVEDLKELGLHEIAKDAMHGRYDP